MPWDAQKDVKIQIPWTELRKRLAQDASQDLARNIDPLDVVTVEQDPDDASLWHLVLKRKADA